MTDKYSDLKKAAEAANDESGGLPWAYEPHGDTGGFGVGVLEDAQGNPVQGLQNTGEMLVVDPVAPEVSSEGYAKFIALASPATMLALLADLDEAQLELSGVETAKKDLAEVLGCADEPRWKWLYCNASELVRQNEKLKAEAESLRAELDYLRHPFRLASGSSGTRCMVCGQLDGHTGLNCPSMRAHSENQS